MINEVMPSRTTREWVADLLQADILFGEVFSPEQLLDDPHMQAVGMFPEAEHPTEGKIRLIGYPGHASLPATRLTRLPPTFGQHRREVLLEAGLTEAEIDDLANSGAVVETPGGQQTRTVVSR